MNDKNKNDKKNQNNNRNTLLILLLGMAALAIFSLISRSMLSGQTGAISYDEFLKILETRDVEEVVFNEVYNRISAEVKEDGRKQVYTTAIVDKDAALEIITAGTSNTPAPWCLRVPGSRSFCMWPLPV